MQEVRLLLCALSLGLASCAGAATTRGSGIELIGTATVRWDALDRSGLDNTIGDRIPHARLGSFGSAIDYTGKDDLYICAADRGPGDGATAYRPRVQSFRITIAPGDAKPVRVEHVATTLLSDDSGQTLWGYSGGYDARDQRKGVRFDAEGLRTLADGSMWISDEYGPWIDRFDAQGRRVQRLAIPEMFMIATPGNAEEEMPPHPPGNSKGRLSNRGFEGLALTPRGTLVAMLQSPLIQDHALNAKNQRIGRNIRALETDPVTAKTRQWVYPLSDDRHGVNEILACDETTFIVLERDGKGGLDALERGLYLVNTIGATDVSGVHALPRKTLPPEIVPARKQPLIDFLDPALGLAGPGMPEKIEGLTFGPTLPGGRRTLIVTSDNDFLEGQDTQIWVFAIAPELLVFEPWTR